MPTSVPTAPSQPASANAHQPKNEYDPEADLRVSIEFAYEAIRARVAAGGKGWGGYPLEPK
jgi:hypothetical protein